MKRYEVTWYGDDEDLKFLRTTNSRVCLVEFSKSDFEKAKELFADVKFNSGLYILEGLDKDEPKIYVGESDNVWSRVRDHINGRTQIKDVRFIERVTIILSSDSFAEFTKQEMHYFERKLINDFKMMGSKVGVVNKDSGNHKTINNSSKKIYDNEYENIKTSLYLIGKTFFINTLERVIDEPRDNYQSDQLIAVYPIINKKNNIQIEEGNFKFNRLNNSIKILKDTKITGFAKNSNSQFETMKYTIEKMISEHKIRGEFNSETKAFNIIFIEDVSLKPSTAGRFIRGGINNGWVYWKDEQSKLIDDYR